MVVFTGSTVWRSNPERIERIRYPKTEGSYQSHFFVKKNGFLGLFGKKPAQVDIEAISETTVIKANQQAVKGVPKEINESKWTS